jgi:NAD(P)-dependent dehydrogenase (short-subunit alcohol dehydrogenase family)
MNTDKDLQGQVAIVTGASRNLGRGLAEMFARRGASVVVHWNADRSRADAEETARRVREAGAVAELVQADLASAASTATVIDRCFERFGRLDILVNNAGIIVKKPFAELTDHDFEQSFAINTRAPFILMRAAASRMHEGGRIVNVGTTVLGCSFPFYGVYAASKAPLEHMTRALAKELSPRKISVNTHCPGRARHRILLRRRDAGVGRSHQAVHRRPRPSVGCGAARRVSRQPERHLDVGADAVHQRRLRHPLRTLLNCCSAPRSQLKARDERRPRCRDRSK